MKLTDEDVDRVVFQMLGVALEITLIRIDSGEFTKEDFKNFKVLVEEIEKALGVTA